MRAKIPATVVTGFLGAGKTTLIRNMLQNANGKRIALIINEFGDLGVDGDILKGCGDETCPEDDVMELSNGCICCTVAEDFVPTLEKLLDRETPPDHIVIETSGLALPQPLVRAFQWPEISTRVTVDGVVTVVDGKAVSEGVFAANLEAVEAQRRADENLDHETPLSELFEDQIACADMIVVNKIDRPDARIAAPPGWSTAPAVPPATAPRTPLPRAAPPGPTGLPSHSTTCRNRGRGQDPVIGLAPLKGAVRRPPVTRGHGSSPPFLVFGSAGHQAQRRCLQRGAGAPALTLTHAN